MDLEQHLLRQMAFSHAAFGPGRSTKRVVAHIRKELDEVLESDGSPEEWVDVVILALDGLTRSLAFVDDGHRKSEYAARKSILTILDKQSINESRTWPDWRTVNEDMPIEHDRSGE